MNAATMITLNDIYINILKMGKKMYEKSDNTINSAQYLESYSSYLGEMNEKMTSILELTDKYAKECLLKANDIRKALDVQKKYDDPMFMTNMHKDVYKNITWAELAEKDDNTETVISSIDNLVEKKPNIQEFAHTPIMYKNMSNIYGKPIGFECKIPVISNLNEMPSSIYWYNGDSVNPAGIYTCLTRGFCAQIPFPNVIDSTQDFNRTGSIKCKYNTIHDCLTVREELAERYNSTTRECKFAHKGERYIKIGTSFRCQNKPRFGNHSFLKDDLNSLPDSDIKTILMYSLSDMLLGSLWFQKQNNDGHLVMSNIDIC